jgi:tetraacyldisaccharide 4'-kinase
VAFCGIGNPEGFRRTLSSLCCELIDFRVFPDHHPYTALDVGSLEHWVAGSGANLVLTTQKDSVKLRAASLGPAPLRALRIGLEITAGREIMDDHLARLLPGRSRGEPREKDFV